MLQSLENDFYQIELIINILKLLDRELIYEIYKQLRKLIYIFNLRSL